MNKTTYNLTSIQIKDATLQTSLPNLGSLSSVMDSIDNRLSDLQFNSYTTGFDIQGMASMLEIIVSRFGGNVTSDISQFTEMTVSGSLEFKASDSSKSSAYLSFEDGQVTVECDDGFTSLNGYFLIDTKLYNRVFKLLICNEQPIIVEYSRIGVGTSPIYTKILFTDTKSGVQHSISVNSGALSAA